LETISKNHRVGVYAVTSADSVDIGDYESNLSVKGFALIMGREGKGNSMQEEKGWRDRTYYRPPQRLSYLPDRPVYY
jgi:hypothetical protein